MKILIDMNLSPDWVPVLAKVGWEAIHWSNVGDPRAPDNEIMVWAKSNGYTVLTHDLDFGAILAATKAESPSVVQVRMQNVNPHHIGNYVISVLDQFQDHLKKGALISVDKERSRARILPIEDQTSSIS